MFYVAKSKRLRERILTSVRSYFEHCKDGEIPMKMKIMFALALSSFSRRRIIADSSPPAHNFELRIGEENATKITIFYLSRCHNLMAKWENINLRTLVPWASERWRNAHKNEDFVFALALSSFSRRRMADPSPSARNFELRKINDDEIPIKISIYVTFCVFISFSL